MKYYKITDISLDLEQKSKGLVADVPSANGEFVPNGAFYFDRMRKREIIEDAPIFDYFHLQSFDKKNFGNGDCKMYMVEWGCIQVVHFGISQIN